MHKIHTTEALVLMKRGAREADTSAALLTRELGLIRASAKSARREKSKLRYSLEPLTVARFSLVKGRNEWKLIGAQNPSRLTAQSGELVSPELPVATKSALGRISKLLLRLIQGEEPVQELYGTVVEGFSLLSSPQDTSASREAIEIILVLRILAHLGYLPHTEELQPFISEEFYSIELAAQAARSRALLIRAINESLQSSGL